MTFTAEPARYDGRMPYRRCGTSGLKLLEWAWGRGTRYADDGGDGA